MRLWLWRHAAVALPGGYCYGISDVPAQAEATRVAAAALVDSLPAGVPLAVSGLMRAQQLAAVAQRLRPALGAVRVDPRLNEFDFGRFELVRWDAIPPAAFDPWMADFADHRFGGEDSTQALIGRVAAALLDAHRAGTRELAWVTHAGVIRAAQYLRVHGPRRIAAATEWPREAPAPGGYTVIDF